MTISTLTPSISHPVSFDPAAPATAQTLRPAEVHDPETVSLDIPPSSAATAGDSLRQASEAEHKVDKLGLKQARWGLIGKIAATVLATIGVVAAAAATAASVGIAAPALPIAIIALVSAVSALAINSADLAFEGVNFHHIRHGKEGLRHGTDAIANAARVLLKKAGVPDKGIENATPIISLVARCFTDLAGAVTSFGLRVSSGTVTKNPATAVSQSAGMVVSTRPLMLGGIKTAETGAGKEMTTARKAVDQRLHEELRQKLDEALRELAEAKQNIARLENGQT